MSDIIQAREMVSVAASLLARALALMKREPHVRRAPGKRQRITAAMRQKVIELARTKPTMTEHEIAEAVGLRNAGRVSEILNRKRKRTTKKGATT